MAIQRRSLLWATALGASTALLGACGGGDDDDSPTGPTVVDVIKAAPDFDILEEALAAADLVTTLDGRGPFTVFAPTDAAFNALLTELNLTKEQLLADKPLLTSVLKYHVLPSRVGSSGLRERLGQPLTALEGGFFKVEDAGGLKVTDGRNRVTNITTTGVPASNGVIHVVDRVLLPANRTIVQMGQASSDFTVLVQALVAANLVDTLNGPGPFTVFAPTDAAFASALAELGLTLVDLLADTTRLAQILRYHVVPGLVLKAQVPVGTPIATLQGATFTVGADLVITDQLARRAQIGTTDILASNGVIHVIDRVLLPTAI